MQVIWTGIRGDDWCTSENPFESVEKKHKRERRLATSVIMNMRNDGCFSYNFSVLRFLVDFEEEKGLLAASAAPGSE